MLIMSLFQNQVSIINYNDCFEWLLWPFMEGNNCGGIFLPAVQPFIVALWSQADSVEVPYKGINNLISYNDKDEEENKMSPFLKAKIIKILSSEGQTLIDATDSSKLW